MTFFSSTYSADRRFVRSAGFILASTLTLTACTNLRDDVSSGFESAKHETEILLNDSAANGPVVATQSANKIKRFNTQYVSTDTVAKDKQLPSFFETIPYTLNLLDAMYLDDIAGILTKMTQVPVKLSPELMNGVLAEKTANDRTQFKIRLNVIKGDFASILDLLAAQAGVSWRYENGSVKLYRFMTRTFTIAAQQGKQTGTARVSNDSRLSGTGGQVGQTQRGGSRQTTEFTAKTHVWADIEKTVPTMLSQSGKYWVAESSSTITVRDTEAVLSEVSAYINSLNDILSRQVQFLVRVLNVTQNDREQLGIDWDLIYQRGDARFTWASPVRNLNEADLLNTLSGAVLGGPFEGSQIFVDALAEQGDVSEVTNPQLLTLNNQPTHLIVGRRTSFIGRVEAFDGEGDGDVAQTLEIEDIITGFSVMLHPNILNDDELQLQIAVDRSELVELKEFNVGVDEQLVIQAPDVDISNAIQRVRLRSNQTIVLTGFEQHVNNQAKEGLGQADWWFFGGSNDAQKRRQTIVILITPVILDS